MVDNIFFHEDYYRQIELVPEENYFKVLSLNETHMKEESFYGFNEIAIREDHLIKTSDLKIPLNEIKVLLNPLALSFFNSVSTGYSNNTRIKKDTIAFGFERIGVFVEFNSNIITNMWICQSQSFEQSQYSPRLLKALSILGTTYKLVLIDWDEEIVVRLANLNGAQKYLRDVFGFKFFDDEL